jgi:very-short-patch-repair endonuclease
MPDLIHNARRMRKAPTDAEEKLWRLLRQSQLGAKFRRQHPIAGFILDFYCPSARLAIELDGGGHTDARQQHYDEHRDRALRARNIRVLRIWNPEVLRNEEAVMEQIWACIHGAPIPPSRGRVDVP